MEEDKFKDLLDDEELKSLRLAALATKRKKEQNVNNDFGAALPINSIVTSSASESSHQTQYNKNYSWRKQIQLQRRRGGGTFPKNSNRSNLIVISPVSLDEEKNVGKKAPALLLPQHKWCNSGNEDSMSPKTLRKTGPTRFNRHGSDSESSESDYENDSGSNETVLQDEPAEHFSPNIDTVSDGVEKKRRFSFQNLESEMKPETFDKTEAPSIYNLLKNPSYDCPDNKPDNYVPVQSDGRHVWNHSVENEYCSYKQFNSGKSYVSKPLGTPEEFVGKQMNSLIVSNGETCIEMNNFMSLPSDCSTWQNTDIKTPNSYYSTEVPPLLENPRNHEINDVNQKKYSGKRRMSKDMSNSGNIPWQHVEASRIYKDDNVKAQLLSEGDLHFEHKKQVHEVKSKSLGCEKEEYKSYNQSNPWDKTNRENWERSEYNSNLNPNQYHHSSSREKTKEESSFTAGRIRYGYSSGPEKSRHDQSSSSPGQDAHEQSADRSRSRRSSSRDRKRNKRSSSLCEGFDEERDRLSISQSKAYESQNKSRYEFSSSQNKRRRRNSSSSDSRHEWSASSDSQLDNGSNRTRSKKQYTASRDRTGYKRECSQERQSPSRDKSLHIHSPSHERGKHRHSSSRDRSKSSESQDSRHADSSSQDEHGSNSRQRKSRHNYIKKTIRSTYNKYNANHKSTHDTTLSQAKDRQECLSGQEMLKKSKNTLEIEKSASVRENIKFKANTKEFNYMEREKNHSNSDEENRDKNKVSLEKDSKVNASTFRNRVSRSRSSSSTSCSSSSSSNSQRLRPKIRSVSSVVKSVSQNNVNIQNRETVNETKSSGKIASLNISLSDVSSASSKKNIDMDDYNKSSFKVGRVDVDLKASDSSKRVPVHMRLGVLPRKRVIQMPKDVEAAFVNSSSSSDGENFNSKCKRQNIRIVTDVYGKSGIDFDKKDSMTENSATKSPDLLQEKSKHLKIKR